MFNEAVARSGGSGEGIAGCACGSGVEAVVQAEELHVGVGQLGEEKNGMGAYSSWGEKPRVREL